MMEKENKMNERLEETAGETISGIRSYLGSMMTLKRILDKMLEKYEKFGGLSLSEDGQEYIAINATGLNISFRDENGVMHLMNYTKLK